MDFIFNGQGHGDVATTLINNDFDIGTLRPWIDKNGKTWVNRNGKAVVAANTPATLRKEEWIQFDTAIVKAAQTPLKFVSDLRKRGLTYTIPNGLGKTVLQYQDVGDINGAEISMDALKTTPNDRPEYDLHNLPLPIIHKDFFVGARELATSRNSGSPLDTTMAEMCARKVAETAERLCLGLLDSYTFGGGTIYGLKTTTAALTYTLTSPATEGWVGSTLIRQILAMRTLAYASLHYGPFALYCSPAWDAYLDEDYSSAKGDNTLRERLLKINGITGCTTLDYLTDYDLFMVQMTPDVIRVVVGMELSTIQWETMGGLKKNFKVMAILVPQLRTDQAGHSGIVYGSV